MFIYGSIFVKLNEWYVYKQYIIQESNISFRKPPLLGPPLSLPEVGNFIEIVGLKQPYHGPRFTGMCVKHRGYGFTEFEISSSTSSTTVSANLSPLEARR